MAHEYFNVGLKPNLTIPKKDKEIVNDQLLNKYQEYLNNGTIFQVIFSRCNREKGDFFKETGHGEEMITLYMPHDESITPASKNQNLSKKLLLEYNVVVIEVDEEKRIITVSHKIAIRKLKNTLQRRINKELKRSDRDKETEKIIVPAKVVTIDKSRNVVIVDLCGYGLPGYVQASQWQHLFTKDVGRFAEIGSVVDVEVLFYAIAPLGKNGINMYACSRKNVIENPWKGIEERFKVKDIVRITCVDKTKKHWFGTIDGLNDIQVFCEYPDASNRVTDVRITIGQEYEGYIYSVSEEKMLLKARVFREIKS